MSVFSFSTVNPSDIVIELGGISSPFDGIDGGEADEVRALGRLLPFRIEPDAELHAGRDLFADGVDVLVPRDLLARPQQLARARTIDVVALPDGPFHELRSAIHQIAEGSIGPSRSRCSRRRGRCSAPDRRWRDARCRRPGSVDGRISTSRTQRGSVSGMSLIGRYQTSWCCGAIVYAWDVMTRSGGP